MALIDRINEVNRQLPNRQYYRLDVNRHPVGFVDAQIIDDLTSELFVIDTVAKTISILFVPAQRQQVERKIEQFFQAFFLKKGLNGWRNEQYAVSSNYGEPPLLLIERAALSYLGITGYGVHVNGYVEKPDGLYMWVAKRALNKPTAAGKLDQIAAGGLPYGLLPFDNLIKECEEEASIPASLAKQAKSVSSISYWYDLDIGVRPDVIFNYDLKLPLDFTPEINDDEVDSFQLLPINEVLNIIEQSRQFKFNSAVVIIDFAIRHGIITPEHPDYLGLQEGMNQRWKHL